MLSNNYVIFSDNGTLIDFSREVNNINAGSRVFNYTTAQDYLYLGSDMPFNHRYFQINTTAPGTVNAVAATATVEIWDGTAWNAAVRVLDLTPTNAAQTTSLAQNGIISWIPDRNKSWQREATTEDIPALATLKIYDMYWVRLSWNATLTATTSLFYVGHKFSEDADLANYYPDLLMSDVLAAFQTGKTNWNTQHVLAAEEIITDLRSNRQIYSSGQIIDWEHFRMAGAYKTAEIIYRGFGAGQIEMKRQAKSDYDKAMGKPTQNLDLNKNARLETQERVIDTFVVRR